MVTGGRLWGFKASGCLQFAFSASRLYLKTWAQLPALGTMPAANCHGSFQQRFLTVRNYKSHKLFLQYIVLVTVLYHNNRKATNKAPTTSDSLTSTIPDFLSSGPPGHSSTPQGALSQTAPLPSAEVTGRFLSRQKMPEAINFIKRKVSFGSWR